MPSPVTLRIAPFISAWEALKRNLYGLWHYVIFIMTFCIGPRPTLWMIYKKKPMIHDVTLYHKKYPICQGRHDYNGSLSPVNYMFTQHLPDFSFY